MGTGGRLFHSGNSACTGQELRGLTSHQCGWALRRSRHGRLGVHSRGQGVLRCFGAEIRLRYRSALAVPHSKGVCEPSGCLNFLVENE